MPAELQVILAGLPILLLASLLVFRVVPIPAVLAAAAARLQIALREGVSAGEAVAIAR